MTFLRWLRPPPVASFRPRLGGGRSSILAAALVALAAAWWLPGDGDLRGTAAFPPAGGLAGGIEREMAPIEEPLGDGRAGAAAESSPMRIPAAQPGASPLAGVSGRVLAGGLPVVEQEIELVPLAGNAARGAWDLTDEEGLYEVQLAPGRYAVLLDGILAPEVFLEVPCDALQVRSNLTLANVAPAD